MTESLLATVGELHGLDPDPDAIQNASNATSRRVELRCPVDPAPIGAARPPDMRKGFDGRSYAVVLFLIPPLGETTCVYGRHSPFEIAIPRSGGR